MRLGLRDSQATKKEYAHYLISLFPRGLKAPQQWHRQCKDHKISDHVQGGKDSGCEVRIDALPLDRRVPIWPDGHALEDGAESLSGTIAKDEDAYTPQGNHKRPADGEDATIEKKDWELDTGLEDLGVSGSFPQRVHEL